MLISKISSDSAQGKGVYAYLLIVLFILSLATSFSVFYVSWAKTDFPDLGLRLINFLFFPVSIFCAFAFQFLATYQSSRSFSLLEKASRLFHRFPHKKFTFALILAAIFVPSTIVQAFPRFIYDKSYSPVHSNEWWLAPEEHYKYSLWVRSYVNDSGAPIPVFTGSLSAWSYVLGYGRQDRWFKELFNITLVEEPSKTGFVLFYVVNRYNLQLPDGSGQTISNSTLKLLQRSFNSIYDNGVIVSYSQAYEPPS
jgi:hypothetical protein